MRIGFHTMEKHSNREPNSVGSSRIRARWLFDEWEEAEEFKVGQKYDVVIFQKVYWKDYIKSFNGISILDLCDPDWLDGAEVIEHCHLVDAITTSSENLAIYVRKFVKDKPVIYVPDRIRMQDIEPYQKTKHREVSKTAVWHGYSHNQRYLYKTLNWLTKYELSLEIISNEPFNPPPGFKTHVGFTKWSYPDVYKEIARYDLLLMPSVQTEDYRGHFKSNNKSLDGYALKIPVINEPEDFERLITKEAREQEVEEKLQLIKDQYLIKHSIQQYKDIIDQCLKER